MFSDISCNKYITASAASSNDNAWIEKNIEKRVMLKNNKACGNDKIG